MFVKCVWVDSYGWWRVLRLGVFLVGVRFAREKGVNLAFDNGCIWADVCCCDNVLLVRLLWMTWSATGVFGKLSDSVWWYTHSGRRDCVVVRFCVIAGYVAWAAGLWFNGCWTDCVFVICRYGFRRERWDVEEMFIMPRVGCCSDGDRVRRGLSVRAHL